MKQQILLLSAIASCTSLFGVDYYLQGDMPVGKAWLDKLSWFDSATVGEGSTLEFNAATIGGNDFYLNGFDLRTGSTATLSSTFSGNSLNFMSGGERLWLMAANTFIDNAVNARSGDIRVHTTRTGIALSVGTLNSISGGDFYFRAATAGQFIDLSTLSLSGDGSVNFGWRGTTPEAVPDAGDYTLSVVDASTFTGTLTALEGKLTFVNALSAGEATLVVDTAGSAQVEMQQNISFGFVDVGNSSLAAGTYTAAELNSALSTSLFSGAGSLTVVYGQTAPTQWQGFAIQEINGGLYVDTGTFMGWLEVTTAPFVYSSSLQSWVYIQDNSVGASGSWVYVPR